MKPVAQEASKKRLSSEERQGEIIRAAVALAEEKDVGSITTQEMAQVMNLTQGAIFRHFASKDEIWLAVMNWIREHLMQTLEKATADARGPLDAIRRMYVAHIAFVSKHPSVPRILFSELQHSRHGKLRQLMQQLVEGYEKRIMALLEQAQQAGEVRDDVDLQSAAILYIGMVQGLVMQASIYGSKRAMLQQAEKIFPLFLQGVCPYSAAPLKAASAGSGG